MSDAWVEDPVFRVRHRFWRDGDVQHVETVVEPGGGVSAHVHPVVEERFVVHEGRCQFLAGRRWSEAGPGQEVVVPPGTRHAFRNRGAVATRIECRATPPSSLQAFLEDAAGVSRAGKLLPVGLPRPNGVLEAALLVERYDDMVRFGFPVPPRPIAHALFGPLARLAERRGLRAGELKALA
jgi:mannose-6-phosphate isomerase-like protein (cupin superfamily)